MKTCPVCQAGAFDDAEVCFGCLYRFKDEDGAGPAAGDDSVAGAEVLVEAADEPGASVAAVGEPLAQEEPATPTVSAWPVSFLIRLQPPASGSDRAWTCSVEAVSPQAG